MKLTQETCDVLNILIWKLPLPVGCRTAHDAARFMLSELWGKGEPWKSGTGIVWDKETESFKVG